MLTLLVEATSGHYKIPGQVGTMGIARSFPIAPPSTIRGFLEAMSDKEFGEFTKSGSRFSYGYLRSPEGHGHLLRKSNVWGSGGIGPEHELIRPMHIETWFGLTYIIQVEGAFEKLLRQALRGEKTYRGVPYLGESQGSISWWSEFSEALTEVEWVVPGSAIPLIVRTPPLTSRKSGFGKICAEYGVFNLTPGTPHFFD